MNGFLLDTSVLSELRQARPEPGVVDFIAAKPLDRLFICTATLAEIRFGIERIPAATQRVALLDWLSLRLRPMFERRVLEVNENVMFRWRMLVEEGRKAGHAFAQPTLMIAATALVHGLTVVTRDAEDFALAGVRVANPWRISE